VLKLNEFKEKGDKTPTDSTANMFGVHKSCVSKWNKQANQLRQALQNPNLQMPGHADHVSDEHPSAKRIYLGQVRHKGASMWPLAEELVYREYKRRREKGVITPGLMEDARGGGCEREGKGSRSFIRSKYIGWIHRVW